MQKWHKVIVLVTLAILLLTACARKEITGTVVEKMMSTSRNGWMYVEVNTGDQNVVLHVDTHTYMVVEVGGRYTFERVIRSTSMWAIKKGE